MTDLSSLSNDQLQALYSKSTPADLSAMSDADFEKRRIEQAEALWKRVAPRTTAASVTTPDFYLYGTVDEDRLKQLGDAAQAQLAALAGKYPLAAGQKAFRGRLILFVTKDRFDYEEFNTVLMNNRRTPRAISGHVMINTSFEIKIKFPVSGQVPTNHFQLYHIGKI